MGFAARFVTGYLHDPAADRACVNTVCHSNDLCDALGAGLGIGAIRRWPSKSNAPARSGYSRSISASGSFRPGTSSSTAA